MAGSDPSIRIPYVIYLLILSLAIASGSRLRNLVWTSDWALQDQKVRPSDLGLSTALRYTFPPLMNFWGCSESDRDTDDRLNKLARDGVLIPADYNVIVRAD